MLFVYLFDTDSGYRKFDNYFLDLPSNNENKAYILGAVSVPDGDVATCKKHCNDDDRCKLFNYYKKNKFCYLKSVKHTQVVGKWRSNQSFDAYEKG